MVIQLHVFWLKLKSVIWSAPTVTASVPSDTCTIKDELDWDDEWDEEDEKEWNKVYDWEAEGIYEPWEWEYPEAQVIPLPVIYEVTDPRD
jgi:hypothetical protein